MRENEEWPPKTVGKRWNMMERQFPMYLRKFVAMGQTDSDQLFTTKQPMGRFCSMPSGKTGIPKT